MFGMLPGLMSAFSPVWKTRNPARVRSCHRVTEKATSLPKAAFSWGVAPLSASSDTWIPRLPVPFGGLQAAPVTPNEP